MDDQAKVALLQRVIQFNTVNGNERALAEFLKGVLAQHHIDSQLVEFADQRACLVAEIGDQPGKVLAFAGHMDTVATGDPDKWQYPPFSATINNGSVYGRGSVDMKGGLTAMVIALIQMKEAGLPKQGKVRLLISVDEEVGGMGSMLLTKRGYADDLDAMVMCEASSGQLEYAHCGSFDYEIKSFGKTAHSSRPDLGINAVANLARFIDGERTAFDDTEESPVLGKVIHSVTVFHGGDQLNSIPDYAFLKGNVRTVPECNNAETQRRLQKVIDELNAQGANLKLKVIASFAPVVTDPADPFIDIVQQAAAMVTGNEPQVIVSHGATDASRYSLGKKPFAFVEYGPGDDDQSHQINEHLKIADFLQAPAVYQKVAEKFLI
ncbi:ArgE/DapE family deacylase [Limosilactobacillus caecicola]|uniref:ArgE/DapE family deacylase n=1 Tax=Limosilactobacillus caecicola TaxID=2941332 RepID=UPI0020411857|nr:ArgE/DapE family deacylase [Limosilactobacillus caecicola]